MPIQKRFGPAKRKARTSMCSACRGMLNLCGRERCPIIQRIQAQIKVKELIKGNVIFGASPPSVFVGEWNYPKVYAGPMAPPIQEENLSILDFPPRWIDKTINQIIGYRTILVRGKDIIDVRSASTPGKNLEAVQELAMSSLPIDVEMELTRPPLPRITFSRYTPPMGPSAPLMHAKIVENPRVPPKINYLVGDTDCLAEMAVDELYRADISVYQLTRLLSVGLLGKRLERRLVPTKWSITAIDDILAKRLHRRVTAYPWINEHWVFGHRALGNNIWILMLPTAWMYELLECWLPGTLFLSPNYRPIIPSDHEFVKGRRTYAHTTGGAYYAARLPVLEHLVKIRRQAGVIVFMEIHPEWSAPLGVWRIREICRNALQNSPEKFDELEIALEELAKHLKVPIKSWIDNSRILEHYITQTTLPLFA